MHLRISIYEWNIYIFFFCSEEEEEARHDK